MTQLDGGEWAAQTGGSWWIQHDPNNQHVITYGFYVTHGDLSTKSGHGTEKEVPLRARQKRREWPNITSDKQILAWVLTP